MRIFFIILSLIVTSMSMRAQIQLLGQIRNAKTGEILPYATVAIKGKNIGTLANENGEYQILHKNISFDDSVLFSYMGFETVLRTVSG